MYTYLPEVNWLTTPPKHLGYFFFVRFVSLLCNQHEGNARVQNFPPPPPPTGSFLESPEKENTLVGFMKYASLPPETEPKGWRRRDAHELISGSRSASVGQSVGWGLGWTALAGDGRCYAADHLALRCCASFPNLLGRLRGLRRALCVCVCFNASSRTHTHTSAKVHKHTHKHRRSFRYDA